jgi:hypothetical protein
MSLRRLIDMLNLMAAGLALLMPAMAGLSASIAPGAASAAKPDQNTAKIILAAGNSARIARDTQLATMLIEKKSIGAIARKIQTAHDRPRRALFEAALIYCRWHNYRKDPAQLKKLGREYLADVRTCAAWGGAAVAPAWALDQARFILVHLTTGPVNRIEYWSALPADRRALLPTARLARQLLRMAQSHFQHIINKLNNVTSFTLSSRHLYIQALQGRTQARYYLAFADYFLGLSLPPADPSRWRLFLRVVASLNRWTSSSGGGVFYPAVLLSGKANLHAGFFQRAMADFTKARATGAPLWIQYEARYQQVVALLRSGHYHKARSEWALFAQWIRSTKNAQTVGARMGVKLLAYRIAIAKARTIANPTRRVRAFRSAMEILLAIIRKAPQYQKLIFTHLAHELPAKPDWADTPPLQILAYAWVKARRSDSGSHQNSLGSLAASQRLLRNKNTPPMIRAEALLVAGMAYARLGRLENAALMNLDFVSLAPNDPRAKMVLNLALAQLLRLPAASASSPAVVKLTRQALRLAFVRYHETQWRFAYAMQLAQAKEYARAEKLFERVSAPEPFYLDARYQLVRIAAARLAQAMRQKTSLPARQKFARVLVGSCRRFLHLLAHPPKGAGSATLKRTAGYRVRVLMLEAGAALDPLREPHTAGRILNRLDKLHPALSPRIQGILLRYRIRQCEMGDPSVQILPLIRRYAGTSSQNVRGIIMGLIGQYDRESRRARRIDPGKARRLAGEAAVLLQALLGHIVKEPGNHSREIYAYEQIRARELIRAGHDRQAMALYKKLYRRRRSDLRNFIGVARAAYAIGGAHNLRYARRKFVRIIPHLAPGSNIFWSCYLYLIRANRKLGEYSKATRNKLRELWTIYGSSIGGKRYHKQFLALLAQYHVAK